MILFYFTGTGNSLFAAQKIADSTGAAMVSIPKAIAEQKTYTDDCIGFVYPQYAAGLPKMVRRFILNNAFHAEYLFAVDLYAFIRANALGEIAGILPLDYGAYLKTPNNFIFALNPPKDTEAAMAKAESRLAGIINDISMRKSKPVKPRKNVGNATKHFGNARFKITESCTSCGTCTRVCPAGNIEISGRGPVFHDRCENCYACVNLCPMHAIYVNKAMLNRRQYRNPIISIDAIAESNSMNKGD
ncbi:MAG: EFR1 family ferrodoxin [Peptococcaceae bacterium]|jgi:ferredoxin|nr:EFR1 family ferrodoxin [Peptococcaceae bacterium]